MNAAKDVCRLYIFTSIIFACGCASFSDTKYEVGQSIRTRAAWREIDSGLLFSNYSADFARGWKAGFRSVLVGGDGRPPVVPPRRYWNPTPLRECNHADQQEWLSGFAAGAKAARCHTTHHPIRPFLSSCCNPSYLEGPYSASEVVAPILNFQSTPASDFPVFESEAACTIRLLGIEPVRPDAGSSGRTLAIPIPADTTLPDKDMTKELSPKPRSEDKSGDLQ